MEFTLADDQDDAAADRAGVPGRAGAVGLRAGDGRRRRRRHRRGLAAHGRARLGRVCSSPRRRVAPGWGSSTWWSCSRRWVGCRCPGPFLSSAVLRHAGGAWTRARRPAGVARRRRRRGAPSRSTRSATATSSTGSAPGPAARRAAGVLRGLKPIVLDGHTADWVLVVARTQQGIGTFLVEAPRAELVPGLDVTRRLARLELDDVAGRAASDPTATTPRSGGASSTTRAVLLCAELVGSMQQAASTSRSSTPRSACSSTGRSRRSRRSSTRPSTCSSASSWPGSAPTTRPGPPTSTSPSRAEAAAMAKAFVGEAANEVVPARTSRSTAASASRGTATRTSTIQGQGERPAARLPRHLAREGRGLVPGHGLTAPRADLHRSSDA